MRHEPDVPRVDLRAFRWQLHPLERKLEGALETARLALAVLQRRQNALQDAATRWEEHRVAQERHALETLECEPNLRRHALGYLATLQHRCEALDSQAADLQRQVEEAQRTCGDRQRQLACIEAMRRHAQRQHGQAQGRRDAREADAAWLALDQQRRALVRRRESIA